MRSYRQFCPIGRALDVVGDRWSLLILRELMIHPCRFTDLRDGLPGIASNLLTERLRSLTDAAVIERTDMPPPIATALYRVTPRGSALLPVLIELGRWGEELLATGVQDDHFRARWLVIPLSARLALVDTRDLESLSVHLRIDDEMLALSITADGAHVSVGVPDGAGQPHLIVRTDPASVTALIRGTESAQQLQKRGVFIVDGDEARAATFSELLRRMNAT